MIFFLMKKRRLSLHLLLGVLFVIGSMPSGSEALKCFECDDTSGGTTTPGGTAAPTTCPGKTYKDCSKTSCLLLVNSAGTAVKQECSDAAVAACADDGSGNNEQCVCNADGCNYDRANADINKVVTEPGSTTTAATGSTTTAATGSTTTPGAGSTTAGPNDNGGGDSNVAGLSTSNGKLVFAVLMTPPIYYRYIRGAMAAS